MRRFMHRVGWTLMGFPLAIGYRRVVIDPVPGWKTIYRLGARLANWEKR